ncbi:hypothetical protein DH09_19590 [Bacillaceae bacterium JMAK1]|nr:hypothetical protein DH09_19590 [Bacillaceae bacterium JMAK1]
MGRKIARNEPCPCGSGEKFKKCCIERFNKPDDEEFSKLENLPVQYKKLRKDSRIKQCLHPYKEACSEKIIKSHSIQNNKILKKIATKGKVFMPSPKDDNPFAVMTEYGRKEATIFTGFCGYHDKTVFQPIEDSLFNNSKEHIFLYTYRCFAVEYHKKQEVVNMGQQLFMKKPSLLSLSKWENPYGGLQMAINDFGPVKNQFDKALLDKDFDILTSVVWKFNQSAKFAGTGFEAMTKDLQGNNIQDLLNPDILAKHIFVVVFPDGDKTYCIISWLKANDDLFSGYYQQLIHLNEQEQKNYINNVLPMISENITINTEAWDKWEDYKKDEFGSLIWGMEVLAELSGRPGDRLESPLYDLFEL